MESKPIATLTIAKDDVINLNFRMINKAISAMELMNPRNFKEGILLNITEYSEDPRPPYEIQEIREFLNRVIAENPHIFYYLTPYKNQDTYIIMACISDTTRVTANGNEYFTLRADPIRLKGIISATTYFMEELGESKSDISSMQKRLMLLGGY